MAQRKRTSPQEEEEDAEFEQDLDWLVEETVKLKLDIASLVLRIPRAIIALARGEALPPDAPPKEHARRRPGR